VPPSKPPRTGRAAGPRYAAVGHRSRTKPFPFTNQRKKHTIAQSRRDTTHKRWPLHLDHPQSNVQRHRPCIEPLQPTSEPLFHAATNHPYTNTPHPASHPTPPLPPRRKLCVSPSQADDSTTTPGARTGAPLTLPHHPRQQYSANAARAPPHPSGAHHLPRAAHSKHPSAQRATMNRPRHQNFQPTQTAAIFKTAKPRATHSPHEPNPLNGQFTYDSATSQSPPATVAHRP